ncbi:GPP34 family phosphoprotein [Streptomyces sp. NPDC085946]|uniref:GOLPH3/VPS74 family protein n=1 Tax=Streptomyces sp. NPDC085946 TaxID=3365744 RepID=UPI0037D27F2F
MGTARDLVIVAMDGAPDRPVAQGDLSLTLAGAEVVDLLRAAAVTLDGERVVPDPAASPDDPLLARAAAGLPREEPYEPVEEWLWRRGRGLAGEYVSALEAEGLLARPRGSWLPWRSARPVPVESAARRRASHRWAADEPVLLTLAALAGVRDEVPEDVPPPEGAAQVVCTAVAAAVAELDAVRRRRAVENAAFSNVWRGV